MREPAAAFFRNLQRDICVALEACDGGATFGSDEWQRTETTGAHGGGGISRVLKRGAVFDQAGVNFSEVHGTMTSEMTERLTGVQAEAPFMATGVSLVLHPKSPLIPTTHANFRYLEVGAMSWFGGGCDLTPYYLNLEDAHHFHRTLRDSCNRHDPEYYGRFKKWCDEYFYLPHRKETRGVGGLFFDYLGRGEAAELPRIFEFVKDVGSSFLPSYLPIVERHRTESFTPTQKEWQLIRRGRYVEFNLLYDRGTLFGLKTGGRIESILMSLPPDVRWEYCFTPIPGSPEATLLAALGGPPRGWIIESN